MVRITPTLRRTVGFFQLGIAALLGGTVLLITACRDPLSTEEGSAGLTRPLLAAAPSDGNDNKLVVSFDFTTTISCGTESITRNDRGWFQLRFFGQPNNRNVALAVFHSVLTFTNASGEQFIFHDVGPDKLYIDKNGDLILTITGRSTASGGLSREDTVIGHVVVNLTTGQVVSISGNERGRINDLACDALT